MLLMSSFKVETLPFKAVMVEMVAMAAQAAMVILVEMVAMAEMVTLAETAFWRRLLLYVAEMYL